MFWETLCFQQHPWVQARTLLVALHEAPKSQAHLAVEICLQPLGTQRIWRAVLRTLFLPLLLEELMYLIFRASGFVAVQPIVRSTLCRVAPHCQQLPVYGASCSLLLCTFGASCCRTRNSEWTCWLNYLKCIFAVPNLVCIHVLMGIPSTEVYCFIKTPCLLLAKQTY